MIEQCVKKISVQCFTFEHLIKQSAIEYRELLRGVGIWTRSLNCCKFHPDIVFLTFTTYYHLPFKPNFTQIGFPVSEALSKRAPCGAD